MSVISLVVTKLYEASKERERLLREHKVEVYEKVITFFLEIIRYPDNPVGEERMKDFMFEDGREMFTWGSDKVVKIFCDIRRGAVVKHGETEREMGLRLLHRLEDLIFEVRKDLGYKNKDLVRGDILALYINDINTIL